MQAIGCATATDKVTTHRYDEVYGWLLEPLSRKRSFAMLEIGYGNGGGVRFWRQLFPQCFLYCIDRDLSDCLMNSIQLLKADQSSPEDLEAVVNRIDRSVSLIIDDGSHHPRHQLLSFSILFGGLLAPGGLYIIEDIETSYWRRGMLYGNEMNYGFANSLSAIEAFKHVVDIANRRYLDVDDVNYVECRLLDVGLDPAAVAEVSSISFARNAVMLRKRSATTQCYPQSPYAWQAMTRRS